MALNYLYKMTSTKIKELQPKCNLAFIPLGPTEVHGPHLPLMTDFRSGLELCERAARKLQEEGIESIIATPVTYCAADVTNVFPGNTSLRVETVEMLLEDICLSLARSISLRCRPRRLWRRCRVMLRQLSEVLRMRKRKTTRSMVPIRRGLTKALLKVAQQHILMVFIQHMTSMQVNQKQDLV